MQLEQQLIQWRRDFHRHPEQGFLEIRTASIVAQTLETLGFQLAVGKEVMDEQSCMGKPTLAQTAEHVQWAKEHGAVEQFLPAFEEGYTGIVATLHTGRTGPTIAFRFDMDASPTFESSKQDHVPTKERFRSIADGSMHACGHDAHTAIGLGLATVLAKNVEQLNGVIKLIFHPAEEGTRGAKSMVKAGVVDDVDYLDRKSTRLNSSHVSSSYAVSCLKKKIHSST